MRISDWSSDVCSSDLLPALDDEQVDLGHVPQEADAIRLGLVAQLVHERPAPPRADHHLGGAGGAVLVGILAGFVDVEGVVRVLHGGDAQAAAHQGWDELHDKRRLAAARRSEEHTSELQSLMRTSYAVFCLQKKNK